MPSHVWIAPQNPDPSAILHGALVDAHAGRYEEALAKHLWYHRNAVRYDPGQYAVRLSFALAYWLNLAGTYQPAREEFIRTRDETEQAVLETPSSFDLFHDVAAMNNRLGDGSRTANLFETITAINPDQAPRLYRLAEPYLIAAGRFRQCAPFLNPKRRIELATSSYRTTKRLEDSRSRSELRIPKMARTHFIHDVATLVVLLVINDRADDALSACGDAFKVLDDDDIRTIMNAALSGHLPAHRL